jgi:hypothetical protein
MPDKVMNTSRKYCILRAGWWYSKSSFIPTFLRELHVTPQAGILVFYKTYTRNVANVYWIGMKGTVQDFVKSCDICQSQKYLATSPGGLLQPLLILEQIYIYIYIYIVCARAIELHLYLLSPYLKIGIWA